MARAKEIVEVAGRRYEIRQWGALKGSAMLVHTTRLLGETVAEAGKAASGGQGWSLALLPVLVGAFARSANVADLHAICDALAEETTFLEAVTDSTGRVKTLPQKLVVIGWDDHFAGRLTDLAQWLVAGLKLNFADFLTVAGISLGSPQETPSGESDPQG
jgi:hypothetical protein